MDLKPFKLTSITGNTLKRLIIVGILSKKDFLALAYVLMSSQIIFVIFASKLLQSSKRVFYAIQTTVFTSCVREKLNMVTP